MESQRTAKNTTSELNAEVKEALEVVGGLLGFCAVVAALGFGVLWVGAFLDVHGCLAPIGRTLWDGGVRPIFESMPGIKSLTQ